MSLEKQLEGEKLAINQPEEKQKKITNQYWARGFENQFQWLPRKS
jgi:hypothetical protein